MENRTSADMDSAIAGIRQAPADNGRLDLVISRPDIDEREELEAAELHPDAGLVGDNWATRGSGARGGGPSDPDRQLTIMNSRVIDFLAGDRARWSEAGDQLYADFDLSSDNAPAGTRIAIGQAVVEITEPAHTGCHKFSARFGPDALRWVNSPIGKELRLRGVNAKVIQPGTIAPGDTLTKVV